jgi:predicted N-formylglutamate amidohydrolase
MFKIVITCEHGGNQVPERYADLFKNHEAVLATHQGWDIGALKLANKLASVADFFFYTEVTRLLVDLNRSINHPKLFSFITKNLESDEKSLILEKYFYPYRKEVSGVIEDLISHGNRVLHVSVHTFTPVLGSVTRNNDIGLLYDPGRLLEKKFNHLWEFAMHSIDPNIKIRFNYPYRGKSDGFVNYFRKRFSENVYICSELEVNQKFFLTPVYSIGLLEKLIVESFSYLMQELSKW